MGEVRIGRQTERQRVRGITASDAETEVRDIRRREVEDRQTLSGACERSEQMRDIAIDARRGEPRQIRGGDLLIHAAATPTDMRAGGQSSESYVLIDVSD